MPAAPDNHTYVDNHDEEGIMVSKGPRGTNAAASHSIKSPWSGLFVLVIVGVVDGLERYDINLVPPPR